MGAQSSEVRSLFHPPGVSRVVTQVVLMSRPSTTPSLDIERACPGLAWPTAASSKATVSVAKAAPGERFFPGGRERWRTCSAARIERIDEGDHCSVAVEQTRNASVASDARSSAARSNSNTGC